MDAAMGLLLLSNPKSTMNGHDVDEDLLDNPELLPVDTPKLPDLVVEMDRKKNKKKEQSAR